MQRVAIFASGNGTNAEVLFNYFKDHDEVEIALVMCNNTKAQVIERAKNHKIPVVTFDRNDLYETKKVLNTLRVEDIDWLALAGFMWLLPSHIVHKYPNKIVNIHPSLLPKFGGKGMYGSKVHQAVLDSGDKETGITIHLVNEEYDKGKIIFQATCEVADSDTPETLAEKIHKLEHEAYPDTLENLILRTERLV
ncbi:MAG: phosphoribosylglycinamide formyltransferase [Cyclobacteriaceae bacterium]